MSTVNVSIRQLRKFVAVATAGSFTRAAADLYIAQPALSAEIKRLERGLGLQLFNRGPKGVTLTSEGQEIFDHAQATLREYDALAETSERLRRHGQPELRVGFMAQGPGDLLPRVLRAFRESHPHVNVTLHQFGFDDCFLGVGRGATDVSFSIGTLDDSDTVEAARLFDEPVAVAMAADHALAERERLHVTEILDEPLFGDTHPPGKWRDYWDLNPYRNGNPAPVARQFETHDEWLEGLRLGGGISICPESTPRYYPRPGLTFIPLDGVEPATHSVIWRRNETNTLVHDFIEIALSVANASQPSADDRAPAIA